MKTLIACILAFISFGAFAELVNSPLSKVSVIYSYSEYGNGDVVVELANNGTPCTQGFWLKKADPGFEANLSLIISAYHAKNDLMLYGHSDQVWQGSTGTFCHLYAVNFR